MDNAPAGPVYVLGSFEIDPGRRRLSNGGQLRPLPDRHFDLLVTLCAHHGRFLSKNDLSDAVWHGVAVSDNSIDKAISSLRQLLASSSPPVQIEIRKRVGVRLATPVERVHVDRPPVSIDALLEPVTAFVNGRTALESFDRDAVDGASLRFADAVRLNPNMAAAHTGLANALWLRFEATRADAEPDRAALEQALQHALEACRLDPASADAWSALACVRQARGDARGAVAAGRKAVLVAPDAWEQYLRLAYVSWGSERLNAARQLLSLYPVGALGHWFAATVHVARQAFDHASMHLRAGCAAQDMQPPTSGRVAAIGLHLLYGLVRAAQGDLQGARHEFSRELAVDHPGHVYARECAANTCCAIGGLALRDERIDEARRAFGDALARVPGHGMATAGLELTRYGRIEATRLTNLTSPIESAFVQSVALVWRGRHVDAARLCADALLAAEPGSSGYLLAVEPLLRVTEHRDEWQSALAVVANRAS